MLGWFAETTLIAAGLAFVAVITSRVRAIGPTTRHALWLVVMIKLVTPPLLSWPWATPSPISDWIIASPQDLSQSREGFVITDGRPDQRQSEAGPTAFEVSFDQGNSAPNPVEDESSEPPAEWVRRGIFPDVTQRYWVLGLSLPERSQLAWWAVATWLGGSLVLAMGQAIRILRFRRRLFAAVPAPDSLTYELESIGARLGVPVPEILVLPDLGTPMLWCLGRPRLLLPARLVKSLPLDRWRGILMHELAHLRRGDHWVSRLELVAGLIWWWNPVYWLARACLDAEAELACDAWVIWALPKDRVAYAEVLFDVCTLLSLSPSKPPSPALGVAGSGRFFERRLTLILHNHVPCRLSPLALLAACLLLLFAVPSWSKGEPASVREDVLATVSVTTAAGENSVADDDDADDDVDDDKKLARKDKDDDDDDDADDDDDEDDEGNSDDDDAKARSKEKAKIKAGKSERELEELGEKIGKEMEAKFGPGSEFEKKMEAFGKEMEAKFGEDSEFAKRMEAFGKEIEAKFGAGSEFEKQMKDLGEDMKTKFGPGSEFAKNLKEKVDVDVKAKKKAAEKQSSAKAQAKSARTEVAKRETLSRDRRIQKLEAQIRELVDEIKALKAAESEK